MLLRRVVGGATFILWAAGACSLVNAPEEPLDPDDSTGGAGGATTTVGGGGASCDAASDCAHLADECNLGVCHEGQCDVEPLPEGTACGDPSEGPCDAADDCDGAGTCRSNHGAEGITCDVAACITDGTCEAGECANALPKDCSAITVGCAIGVCDPSNGDCTTEMQTTCLDDDACCPPACTAANDNDCCPPATLGTPFNSDNSASGNMFDIVASKPILITGFAVNISGTSNIEIYFRLGSHVGHETTPASWTLAATVSNVTGLGANVPTPLPATFSIAVPAGQTFALYVTTVNGSMHYTNGTAVGNLLASNSDLQIFEGIGNSYPFTSVFAPRNWNGTIHYQCQ